MKRKKPKLTLKTVGVHVQEWKLESEVLRVKRELIGKIKAHCERLTVSQRKLASMVPGLTQDRVSKIFSGDHGHMTIDKLVEIIATLNLKIEVKVLHSQARTQT